MGLADTYDHWASKARPPPWWVVDGIAIAPDQLETGPLPDGTLPDDIKKLHDLVRSLARELRLTRERLGQELQHRFGRHSEKRPRDSGKGNDRPSSGEESGAAPDPNPAGTGQPPGEPGKKPGHGRRPIPPDLPREEIEIPVGDGRCSRCGGPTHHLEYLESYRYDYVPGFICVVVLRRSRRACDDTTCTGPFQTAPLPPEPIPKGRATAGFLAHLLVKKFADHCPLYRFRKILLRQKVDLPRSTLVDYCTTSTELLKPLWELMRQRVLESEILQTDDTHVQVRLPRRKGVLQGHLWVYKGDESHPYVVFAFTPNWKGSGPQAFLQTFEGYIQADAFKGYDELFKDPRRIEVGCMAHARRKWVKAKGSSAVVADQALEMFGQLYAIEDLAKDFTPDQRRSLRQERSALTLETLRVWMDEQRGRALPKSPVAVAIEYARNQWTALTRYLEDGRLKIDNNAAELELRQVALGRKNWMAIGSEVGGETAAIGFTMIGSAVACDINPVEWLKDVLERIVTCPPERLEELLPDRWKAARSVPDPGATGTKATPGQPSTGSTAQPTSRSPSPDVEGSPPTTGPGEPMGGNTAGVAMRGARSSPSPGKPGDDPPATSVDAEVTCHGAPGARAPP